MTIKRMARACTQRSYRVQEVRLPTIILCFQLYLLIFLTSSCCSLEVGRFSRPVPHVSWIRDNLYPLRVYFSVHIKASINKATRERTLKSYYLKNSQFFPDRWLTWKFGLHFLWWPHMQIDIRSRNSTYHFHFCSNLLLLPFVLPDIEERKKKGKEGDVFENEAKPRAWLCGDELSRRWGNVTSQPVSTKQSSCQSSKKLDHAWNTIWSFEQAFFTLKNDFNLLRGCDFY